MKTIADKPSPVTGGQLEVCRQMEEVIFRGEKISYEKSFYRCLDSGLEFVDEELETANLKLMYDTYRRIHSIPLPEELKAMRERYGIPASAMSLILGLGENQYGLYEDGSVPTASVGKLLALAMDPVNFQMMLQSARTAFSEKQYCKYYNAIVSSLHPAVYENERMGVLDYIEVSEFPVAITKKSLAKASLRGKETYNLYAYAPAC